MARSAYGSYLTATGQIEEAEALLFDARQAMEALKGPGHIRTREIERKIQALYRAWDQPEKVGTFTRHQSRRTRMHP